MHILSLETSCDDTAVAIVCNGTTVLANEIWGQSEHEQYGGVVPELAARLHAEHWPLVLRYVFAKTELTWDDIDVIAMTQGPGLQTALLNGTVAGSFLGLWKDIPLVPVHHIYGHMCSILLDRKESDLTFPILVLTVSGGHTQFALWKDFTHFEIIGRTLDDAAGEAFDKCAKMLELGYPGGPIVSEKALRGDRKRFDLPRILLEKDSLDFSFSGLKAAVYRIIEIEQETNRDDTFVNDVCASFEIAVKDTFVRKVTRALEQYPEVKQLAFVGGVSANAYITEALEGVAQSRGKSLLTPAKREYSTDNAAMIGAAAHLLMRHGGVIPSVEYIDADPRMEIS